MAGLLPNGMPACSPNNIVELTHAVERTEMIYNAGKLRLFDALEKAGRPLTSRELTSKIGLQEGAAANLERLLNVNAALGLLKRTDGSEALYSNTDEASVYLTTDSEFSLLTLVDASRHQFDIAEQLQANSADKTRSWFFDVEANEAAYKDIPHRFRRYYLKQDGYTRTSLHLLKSFDLSGYKTCVDLGGGLGTMCRALKTYYPSIEATSYDMPKVITFAKAEEAKKKPDVSINYAEGDLFSDDPGLPKADLYIIGHLLHMFPDEVSSQILQKVHASVNPGGAVLVLEKIMHSSKDGPELCLMYDLRMGFSSGEGKERTREEFDQLFTKNGFAKGEYKENEGYNCYDAILTHKQ